MKRRCIYGALQVWLAAFLRASCSVSTSVYAKYCYWPRAHVENWLQISRQYSHTHTHTHTHTCAICVAL